MPNRWKGKVESKSDPLVLQVEGLEWGQLPHPSIKKNLVPETATIITKAGGIILLGAKKMRE